MLRIKSVIMLALLSLVVLSPMFMLSARAQPGDKPTIAVVPATIKNSALTPGSTFDVNVSLYNATPSNVPPGILGVQFELSWDTGLIQPVSFINKLGASDGVLVGSIVYGQTAGFYDGSNTLISSPPYTNATNYFVAAASSTGPWWGNGTMATITFRVLGVGKTGLNLTDTDITDWDTNEVSYYTLSGSFDNTVAPPPLSASISPMSTSIMLGQNVNFTSTVSGGVQPYSYQWYANGTSVLGANSGIWDFLPAASGSYFIHLGVIDNVGNTTASGDAHVTVTQPASLIASISSSSTTAYVGQIVNLGSTVGGGVPPYMYQWLLNGSLITGATLANYTFSPTSSGSYVFSMNVTDSYGSTALSNTVTITVMPPLTAPAIYIDPSQILNLSLGPGSSFSINITVANVTNLGGCIFNLTYDPQVLTWIGFNFVQTQGQYPTAVFTGNTITGYAWISLYYMSPITVQSAPLTVMVFYVNSYGITPLNLTNTELLDQYGNPVVHNTFSGIFGNIIRDVAVTNVVPAASWVYQNWTDAINVTVANLGSVTENFTASAWYNSSLIGSANVYNLAPNANATISFIWNTSGVTEGNYTITGTASYVPYETYFNTTNNVYVDGTVQVLTTIHDVAITYVQPTIPWVYAGQIVPVNVTAANLGDASESFNVTAYYNSNAISTIPVINLPSGTSIFLTFYWDTTGISAEGSYTLSAFASYVPFEYNTTNNYLTGGQELILTQIRDVAITSVQPYPQMLSPIYNVTMVEVYPNRIVTVNVTAANLGNMTETFTVTAWIDGNITLGTQTVSNLPPQNMTILTFYWNPTGQTPSSTVLHTVSANASFVPYEYNTTNNYMASSIQIMIKLLGDINGDGKVSLSDLSALTKAYKTTPGMTNWNPEADINGDGIVNLPDLVSVAKYYGVSY